MQEPETILNELSPHENLEAAVDQDDRVAFLYLKSPINKNFGIKTCWIRNLKQAPEKLDVEGIKNGIPPLLPKKFCKFPNGQEPLKKNRLRIVWFPEGDGVALLEDDKFLTVIPPWGGYKNFDGYARDCIGEGPLCWGLEDPSIINKRIEDAENFWNSWDKDPLIWNNCQDLFINEYEKILGPHTKYYAIDGKKWPPKALVRFDLKDRIYLFSLGISLRPQPQVEMYVKNPSEYRRFEFAACFSREIEEDIILEFTKYLSAQSKLPWTAFTFFAHGHTIPCDSFLKNIHLKNFTFLIYINNPKDSPIFNIPLAGEDPVNLLWCIPITGSEQKYTEANGSNLFFNKFPNKCLSCIIKKRDEIL